jgi:hypothetical protein
MKIFFLINAFCFLSFFAQAQNVFPTPSGSVGIGTTGSPSALLHVHNPNNLGTSSPSTIEIARFSGVNVNISQLRFQLNRYASGNDWYSASMRLQHVIDYTNAGYIEFDPINGNQGIAIGSGNNEIIRFLSSGNVGIGTTAPNTSTKLDVFGAAIVGSGSVNPNTTKLFIRNPAGKTWAISSGVNMVNEVDFGIYNWTDNASTPLFKISSSGNVGIGTVNPQSMLAVKGTITSQRVVVTQSGWADYVFEPTYQLPSLKSVENFIRFNKHLPDVPSAATIEKDGVDLGNNQAVLLKKIEELTLYLIEQDKKQEQLQNEVETLKKKLEQVTNSSQNN